jgi:hypothetical protein
MDTLNRRATAWALILGTAVAAIGYLLVTVVAGGGNHADYTNPHWTGLYSVALAGNIILVAGLPAVVIANGARARRLTLVGVAGTYLALVMLNIGEGILEAYVKPYLIGHGGIPDSVAGFGAFQMVALIAIVVGLVCLGVAVIRARVLGWWIGALILAAIVPGVFPLPGGLAMVSDYLLFAALFAIGVKALRGPNSAAGAAGEQQAFTGGRPVADVVS